MVTTDNTVTETTEKEMEGQAKQRSRINPRVKMVKALHIIMADQLRQSDYEGALGTANDLQNYLVELTNG